MAKEMVASPKSRKNNIRTLAIGGVLGALAGVGVAYLMLQGQEHRRIKTGKETSLITVNTAVNIGMLVFGLLRQVGEISRSEK